MMSREHRAGFAEAFSAANGIWAEARRSILRIAGGEWQKLSFRDKAIICETVVKALLDNKRMTEFLSGHRRSIN